MEGDEDSDDDEGPKIGWGSPAPGAERIDFRTLYWPHPLPRRKHRKLVRPVDSDSDSDWPPPRRKRRMPVRLVDSDSDSD